MKVRNGLLFLAISVGAGLFNYLYQVVAGRILSAGDFAALNGWLANLSVVLTLAGFAQYAANFRPMRQSSLRLSIVVFNVGAVAAIYAWSLSTRSLGWDRSLFLVSLSICFGWLAGQAQIRLALIVLASSSLVVAFAKFALALNPVESTAALDRFAFSLAAATSLGLLFLGGFLWNARDVASSNRKPSWTAPALLSIATSIFPQFDLLLMSHSQNAADFSDFARASLFFRAVYFLVFIGAQWLLPRQIQGHAKGLSNIIPRVGLLTVILTGALTIVSPQISQLILKWEVGPEKTLVFMSSLQVSAMAILLLQVQELCAKRQIGTVLFIFSALAAEAVVQLTLKLPMLSYLTMVLAIQISLIYVLWHFSRSSLRPRWGRLERMRFILLYFLAKMAVPFQVLSPRWTFFWFEIRYSLINLINTLRANTLGQAIYLGPDRLATAYGIFKLRPGSQDAAIASPAFEAADLKYLLRVIDEESRDGTSIDFIDIGANVGTFSVRIANTFRTRNVRVFAVEPIPYNLEILKENLLLNSLSESRVKVLPFALSNRAGQGKMYFSKTQPGNSSLISTDHNSGNEFEARLCRGDDVLGNLAATVVIKIDIEGHEIEALDGMNKTLTSVKRGWLCIEDIFKCEELYAYLSTLGFKCEAKLTPYNSWWRIG